MCVYKQGHKRENDSAFVNAGFRVTFGSGTSLVEHIMLCYGGVLDSSTVAEKTMKALSGK